MLDGLKKPADLDAAVVGWQDTTPIVAVTATAKKDLTVASFPLELVQVVERDEEWKDSDGDTRRSTDVKRRPLGRVDVFAPGTRLAAGQPARVEVALPLPAGLPPAVATPSVRIRYAARATLDAGKGRDASVDAPVPVGGWVLGPAQADGPRWAEAKGVRGTFEMGTYDIAPGSTLWGTLWLEALGHDQDLKGVTARVALVAIPNVRHGVRSSVVAAEAVLAGPGHLAAGQPVPFELRLPMPPQLAGPGLEDELFSLRWQLQVAADRAGLLARDAVMAVDLRALPAG